MRPHAAAGRTNFGRQDAFTVRIYGVSGKNAMLYSEGRSVTFSELRQFTYT